MRPGFRPWMAWAALLVGLGGMLPDLGQRVTVEESNETYEIAIGYRDVASLRLGGVAVERAFDQLVDAGLTSAPLDMITIADLEIQGRLTLLDRADVLTMLLIAGEDPSILPSTGVETFLIVTDDDEAGLVDRIRQAGGQEGTVTPMTVGEQTIYQVSGIESLWSMPLGFDDRQLENLDELGLGTYLRIPNTIRSVDFVMEELQRVRDAYGHDRIQFVSDTTPFPGDPSERAALASRLRTEGFTIVIPENVVQGGIEVFATRGEDIIRIRGLGLARRESDRLVTDTARAVVERNVRIVVLGVHPGLTADERLDVTTESIGFFRELMPDSFELGIAETFDVLDPSPLLWIGAAVATVGMAALAYPLIGVVPSLVVGALLALMIAGMVVTGSTTLGNLTRLGVAVLAATVATFAARPRPDVARLSLQYLRTGVVLIIGGLTVAALAFDTAFLVAADSFWGVKPLLIAPVLLAAAVAAYMSLGRPSISDMLPVLDRPIRIWHALAAGAVIAVIGFMLLRSGNSGIEIDPELVLREQLEDLFGIRPRTKELLIGFPALVLAIVASYRSRHGWWLYAAAAIATASAINTYTHFHSPLVVSTLRTVYGMGVGFVVGLVLLGVAWLAVQALRRVWRPNRDA